MSSPTADTITPVSQRGFSSAVWLLGLCVLVGGVLRFLLLDAQPLWLDEFYTAELAKGGLGMIWRNAFVDIMPPLANAPFWLATQLFGMNAWALRLPSALAALALLPVFWLAARRATDATTATMATGLLALNPLAVYYAQEARPYSWPLLALVLAQLAYERLRRRGDLAGWLLFAGAALLAAHTQYVNVVLLGALGLALLVVAEGRRREVLIGGAITALVAGASLAPFVVGGLSVAGGWHANTSHIQLFDTLALLLAGDSRVAVPMLRLPAVALGVGCALLALAWPRRWEGLLPHVLQVAVLLVVVFTVLPLLGKAAPAHDTRVFLLLLPSLLLLIASGLTSLARSRFGWLLATGIAAGLLAIFGVGLINYYARLEKSPEVYAATVLAAHAAPGDPVVSDGSAYSVTAALRFYHPEYPLYRIRQTPDAAGNLSAIPDASLLLRQPVPAVGQPLAEIEREQQFWLVYAGDTPRADLAALLAPYSERQQYIAGPFTIALLARDS